jgi:hypothetical protein
MNTGRMPPQRRPAVAMSDDDDIELEPLMEDQKKNDDIKRSTGGRNASTIIAINGLDTGREHKNAPDTPPLTPSASPTVPAMFNRGTGAAAAGIGANAINGDEEVGGEEAPHCRICYGDHLQERLVVPCACAGSMRWIHISCLNRWRLVHPPL